MFPLWPWPRCNAARARFIFDGHSFVLPCLKNLSAERQHFIVEDLIRCLSGYFRRQLAVSLTRHALGGDELLSVSIPHCEAEHPIPYASMTLSRKPWEEASQSSCR
jgi:hypothetical protein